jgi:hypothetical protein
MTKTIVHWTEDMNMQSHHPLAQLYSILRIALRLVLLTKPFCWVPVEDMNFYKVVIRSRSYIDYCTCVYIEKPFYCTRVNIDTISLDND